MQKASCRSQQPGPNGNRISTCSSWPEATRRLRPNSSIVRSSGLPFKRFDSSGGLRLSVDEALAQPVPLLSGAYSGSISTS